MSHSKRGSDSRGLADSAGSPLGAWAGQFASGDRRLDLISRQALFDGVPLETLIVLVQGCEVRALAVDEVLLTPGQSNHHLYLLLDGQLDVRIDRLDSAVGFVISPGECAGEISIADGKPATAFVVAGLPSELLVVPESVLWKDFLGVPRIAKNFMRLFADRFRDRHRAMLQALEQELRFEHLQKELAIAHDIQLGMLPCCLDLEPEIDVAAEMTPAQQIGGDFYEAFPVDGDEYCVAIGDVSGKGVPAALFMVRTMALLRSEMLKGRPVEEAVGQLNVLLCEENPKCMFATLVVGILNKRTGAFRYVSAGHDPVLFGRRGTRFRALPRPNGILVGIDAGARYEVASVTLGRGDVVVLYTDGVTEAMNSDHELFTSSRLMDCLAQAPVTSASELAGRIGDAVHRFAGGAARSDDLTMMILRYRGA